VTSPTNGNVSEVPAAARSDVSPVGRYTSARCGSKRATVRSSPAVPVAIPVELNVGLRPDDRPVGVVEPEVDASLARSARICRSARTSSTASRAHRDHVVRGRVVVRERALAVEVVGQVEEAVSTLDRLHERERRAVQLVEFVRAVRILIALLLTVDRVIVFFGC
jgi:hypothetical protein